MLLEQNNNDQELCNYILSQDNDLVDSTLYFWHKLKSTYPDIPLPMVEVIHRDDFPTGKAFQFCWSYESIILEIEILDNEKVCWFVKDRQTKDCAVSCNFEDYNIFFDDISSEFWDYWIDKLITCKKGSMTDLENKFKKST